MAKFSSTYISPAGGTNEIIFITDRLTPTSGGGMDWDKVKRIRETPGVVSPAYLFPGGHVVATRHWLVPWLMRGSIGSQLVVFNPRRGKLKFPDPSPALTDVHLEPEFECVKNNLWFSHRLRKAISKYATNHLGYHTYYLLRGNIVNRLVVRVESPPWAGLILNHFGNKPILAGSCQGMEFIKAMLFVQGIMDICRVYLINIFHSYNHQATHFTGYLSHTQNMIHLHVAGASHVVENDHYLLLDAPGGPLLTIGRASREGDLWHTVPQSVHPRDNDNLQGGAIKLEIVKVKNPK